MLKNQKLHVFFCDNVERLTEEWYASVDKTRDGMYASTDQVEIQRDKSQNLNQFHNSEALRL